MTNFNIGGPMKKHEQYVTSYGNNTGQANHWDSSRVTIGEVAAKKTSVQLGKGNAYGFVTMNQRLFPDKDPKTAI